MHAIGVEYKSFDFAFAALGGDFLAVPKERDGGGIADFYYEIAIGTERSVRGCDQSFFGDGLAVADDGEPGVFGGADREREGSSGFLCWFGKRFVEVADGDIILVFGGV